MFAKVMSRNRFELILLYVHFNSNESDCEDRLFKVRPIIANFYKNFVKCISLIKIHPCIGEGMLSWRGRLGFRAYNHKKPVKYGIKPYALIDSRNSHCSNLKPYCGIGAT